MGSSLNSDKNVRIYMTLNQRMYYSGDVVKGVVHIECLADRPYHYLNVKIQGHEEIQWSQRYDKVTLIYSNNRDTYSEVMLLSTFSLGIRMRHYSFPFSIALPNAIPGSFTNDSDNYIRYTISAELPAYDEKSDPQVFSRSLNIREPARIVRNSFRAQGEDQAACWKCCCKCGTVALTIEADTGQLLVNRTFKVRGHIDNSRGSTKIKNIRLVLVERTKQISEWQYIKQYENDVILYDCMKDVEVGDKQQFKTQVKVPISVLGYTCIGSIIYRAYFLKLQGEVNCCYSNPKVMGHIILNNSLQPQLQQVELQKPPVGWNPVVHEPVFFNNLKPYIYLPSKHIDVSNQVGAAINNELMGQQSVNVLSNMK